MTTPSPVAPPMNHVFVDFENVQHVDLSLIGAKSVSFTLMVGPKQTKLDSDLVEKLMAHSASVQLVKLKSSGKNALDFALAYYLGRAALANPSAYFHIISKDGGFDPLIEHLRSRHIHVYRHASCAELTFTWPGKKAAVSEPIVVKPVETIAVKKVAAKKVAKKAAAKKVAAKAVEKTDPEVAWLERVLKDFKEHPKAQPKKRKALIAKVANLIKKTADAPEVLAMIARMEKAGKLKFDEKDVPEYHLK
jgi:PIN domain